MALMSIEDRLEFESDLCACEAEVRAGVTEDYARRKDRHWEIWETYCSKTNLDPFLLNVDDPVPYLEIFAKRLRDGRIAPSGRQIRSQTVSDYLTSVGQRFTNLGADDPRLNKFGKIDFRLSRQSRCWRKQDKPSVRVKPLPVSVIMAVLMYGIITRPTMENESVANMICIAFFYCMRPGEYTGTTTDEQAFVLDDIAFYIGLRRLDNELCSDLELEAATQTTYCFTEQKNQHKGDVIAHATSGDMLCCPVKATVRQFMIHRRECRKRNKPYNGKVKLASYYNSNGVNVPVKTLQVTKVIQHHAGLLRHVTGVNPKEYTARSLRAGGAMALLLGGCDKTVIDLVGRWHSDSMMEYLHQAALPIYKQLSTAMFANGGHSFPPDSLVTVH